MLWFLYVVTDCYFVVHDVVHHFFVDFVADYFMILFC